MSISLFVNVLKMTLKFKKREMKFDTVTVNQIEFQIKKIFEVSGKNFVF